LIGIQSSKFYPPLMVGIVLNAVVSENSIGSIQIITKLVNAQAKKRIRSEKKLIAT